MDYSLLVGIHDIERAELEINETLDDENGIEEDEDSTGSGGGGVPNVPTPPDSPLCMNSPPPFLGIMDPLLERFAVKSDEGKTTLGLDIK